MRGLHGTRWWHRRYARTRGCAANACRSIGRPVGPGALAHRFFETGVCSPEPELVPAPAWIEGRRSDAALLEHSVVNREHGAVMTILSDPTDVSMERPAIATLPFVTASRDYLLDKLNDKAAAERRSRA